MKSALDVVNRLYDITDHHQGRGLAELVAEDVTFEGPLLKAEGAREYLAMNAQFLPFHRGTRMRRQFVQGDEVCSIYTISVATPKGGTLELDIVDWIQVRAGKVGRQRIYYDPRAFAKAFGMPA